MVMLRPMNWDRRGIMTDIQKSEFCVDKRCSLVIYRRGHKWLPGEIVNRTGPMAYEVNVNGQV